MRFGARAVGAAALVAAVVVASPAGAGASCKRPGEQVIAGNVHVQVVGGPDGDFACLRATGRRHRLGFDGDAGVDRVIVRGRYVAYTHIWYEGEAEGTDLELMNVRSGATHPLDGVSYGGDGVFGSFVLKPNGATAWIVDEGFGWEPYRENLVRVKRCSRRCLRANPRRPRPTLVDRGRGVAISSLRLDGSKISWIRAGRRHVANLR